MTNNGGTADQVLTIGLMFPQTGIQAWAGLECIEAAHAAVALAEDEGLLRPGQVRLLEADVHSAETAAVEAARLIDAGANILHGTILSGWIPPAAKLAEERGVLYWEAVGASDSLLDFGFRNFFRVNVNCAPYGASMADFVSDVLVPAWRMTPSNLRLGVVYQRDSFCESLVRSFEQRGRSLGMAVVASDEVDPTASDFGPSIERLRQLEPDVLMVATYRGPAPEYWRQCVRAGWFPRAFLGTGAWALGQYALPLAELSDGLFAAGTPHTAAISPSRFSARARARLEAWKAKTTKPHDFYTAVDRDLVMVGLTALFEYVLPAARSFGLEDLRAAALSIDVPEGDTVLGYGIKFNQQGDNLRAFPAIMQWQHQRLETVYPEIVATTSAWTSPLAEIQGR